MNSNIKKHFTLSNLITAILVFIIALMLFFPGVKAGVIRTLMHIGLFQPKAPSVGSVNTATLAAPTLLLTDTNHQSIDIAGENGQVLFINFWATWCPPCIAEMPAIHKLYDYFKENGKVKFIMIDVDSQPQRSMGFMQKNKWDLPIYFPGQNIHPDYFRGTLPTTVIVNKKGHIVFKHTGAGDFSNEKFKKFIEELSNE